MPPSNTNPASPSDNSERDALAFQIFCQAHASRALRRDGEREAIESFRKADAFLAVKKKMASGELKVNKPDGPQLAECCLPNQDANHPLNLVAKMYTNRKTGASRPGDLNKVAAIKKWLDRNPTPEGNPEELVNRLNAEFSNLNWDLPTINVARAVFPSYCQN